MPRRSLAVFDAEQATSPSFRYANLGAEACFAALDERRIAWVAAGSAPGVLAPVRIPAGVGGVSYHTALSPARRRTSPYEVFDCRLVLALDDFAKILLAHGYDEVLIFSGWRPPPRGWPEGKLGRRHPGGLAVDVKALRSSADADGAETLDVEADYHGQIDAPSCGANGQIPDPPTSKSIALREILCEAVEARIFTSVLTPNHDRPHANHFHLEVTPEVPWRLVR